MKFLKTFILTFAVLVVGLSAQPAHADEGKIVFASDRDGDYAMFVMSGDGSDQTQITHNSYDDTDSSWVPSSQTLQSGSTPAQALSGDNQTPYDTFEEEDFVMPQQWWTIEVELVLGDRVVVTYTSDIKAVAGFADAGGASRPGVIFKVNDPLGDSIYQGVQQTGGGTEFTAELNGTYEFTFLNPVVRTLQEVQMEYQINPTPTPTPTATRTPIVRTPTRVASTPAISRTTPIPSPTLSGRDPQASTPPPYPSPTITPSPTPTSPAPVPEPIPERGFFVNSLPSQANSGEWDFMDPVALSIIGIALTLVGTLVQLFRGR